MVIDIDVSAYLNTCPVLGLMSRNPSAPCWFPSVTFRLSLHWCRHTIESRSNIFYVWTESSVSRCEKYIKLLLIKEG